MRNLDYQHFVVNYAKDDRDDVPHFLLSISYGADADKSVSPSARQIIAPHILSWYLTTYCNYEFNRFVPVEINVIYKMTFGSSELKFCFFTSMASTGSAMLVVSGAMGTYFVTGNFCFSNELFKLDAMNNLKQFGEIDRLYIDATLYDVKADLKTIDNICYTMASIIFDTPKSQKVVIMSKPGLEFILVRVMLIMEEKKHLELCHVGTHTYNLIERMGHGRLFTSCVKKGAEAKVYVDANLTEIRRNFGVFHDFVMIKLVPRRIWDADVKSHVKGKHAHVFMILPHSTREQCERLIWELKPKACFQIVSKPPAEEFLFPQQNNGRVSPCDLQMDPYSSSSLTQNPKVHTNQVSSLKIKQSSTKSGNVRKKTLPTKSKLQKIPISTINNIRSLPSTSKVQSSVNHISDLPTTSKLDSSVDHINDLPTTSKVKTEDGLKKDSIIITSHNLITLPKKLVKNNQVHNDNQPKNQLPNGLEASNDLMNTSASDHIFENDLIVLEPDVVAIKSERNLQVTEKDPLSLDAKSLDKTDKSLSESKIVHDSTTKVLVKPSSKRDLNIKQVLKKSPIKDGCVQIQTKNVNGEQDVCKNKKPDSYQIRVIDKQLLTVSRLIKIKSPNQKINSKPKTKDNSVKNQGGGCARTVSGQFEIKSKIQKITSKSIKKPVSNISFVGQKCRSLVPNRIQTKTKVQNVNSIDSSKPLFKKISDATSLIVPGSVEIESSNIKAHLNVRPKEITPNVSGSNKPADNNIHDVILASCTSEKLQTTEDCSLTISENIALTNKLTNIIEPENAKLILKKGQAKYNQDIQIESTHSSNNSGEINSSVKNYELNKFNTIDESTPMILDNVQIEPGLQNNLNQNQQPLLISLAGDKHSPLVARLVPINTTIRSRNLKEVSKPAVKKRKLSVPHSPNNSNFVAIEPKNPNTQQIARPINSFTIDKSIQINNRTTDVKIKKSLKRSRPDDEITLKASEIQPKDAVLKPPTTAACLASGNCLSILSKTILPTNQRTTGVAIDKFTLKNSDATGKNGKFGLKKCHSVNDITPKVSGKEDIISYENSAQILAENPQIKPTTSNMDAVKKLKTIYPTDKHPPIVLYRVQIEHDFLNKSNRNNHPLLLRLGGDKCSAQVSRLIPVKPPIRNKNSEQTPKSVSKLRKINGPSSQIDSGSVKNKPNNINTPLPKLMYQELRSSERSLANAVCHSIPSENIVLTNQSSAIDANDNVSNIQISTIQSRSIEIDSTVTDKKRVQIKKIQNNTDKCKQSVFIIQACEKNCPLVSTTNLCVSQIQNGYSKNASQSMLNQNNANIHSSVQSKIDDTRDELIPLDTLNSLIDNKESMDAKVRQIVKESHSGEDKASKEPEQKQANDYFSHKDKSIALNNNETRNDNTHTLNKMDPIDESTPIILESVQIESGFQNNTDKICEQLLLISQDGDKCFPLDSNPTLCQPQIRNGYSKKATQSAFEQINVSDPSCQVVSNNVEIDPEHLKIHCSPQRKKDETRDEPNPLVALGTQIENRDIDENAQQIVKESHSGEEKAPKVPEEKQDNDSFSGENNQIPLNNDVHRNNKKHALKKIDPIDESAVMILDCDEINPGLRNDSEKSQQPIMISPVGNKPSPLVANQMQVKRSYHENSEIAIQPISKRIKLSDPTASQIVSDYLENESKNQRKNSSPQPKKDKTRDEPNPLVALDTQIDNIMIDENTQQIVNNIDSSDKIAPILSEVRQANDTFSDENHQIPLLYHANRNDKIHAMKKLDPIDESAATILECDKTKLGLQNYSVSNQQPLMISLADDKHCLLADSNIQVKPSYHENSEITSQSIIKPLKFSDPSCQTVSDYVENEPKNLSRNSSPQPKIDEVRDEPNSLAVLDTQNYNKTTDKNVEQIVTNIHSSDKKASILSEVKQANDSFSDENHQIPLIYHPNRNDKTHAMKKIDPIDESAATILECDKTKPGLQNYSVSNQQPLMISLADDKHCLLVDSNIQVKPSYHENSEITSQSIIKPLKFSNPSCQTVSDYVENEPKNLSRNSSPQPKIDEVRDEPNSLAVLDNQNYNKTTDKNVEQIVTNIHSSDKKASILSEVKQANDSFSDENHQIPLIYHPNKNDKTHAMKKIDPIDESAVTILEWDKTKPGLQNYSESNQQPLMISLADDKHCLLVDSNIQVKPSYHENSEITSQSIIKPLKFSNPSCQTVSDYVENEPKNLSRNSSPQPKIDEVRDEPNSLAVLDNQNYNKTTDKNVEQIVTNIHSSDKKASILSEVKQANDSFSDENHQIPLIYHPNKNDKTHAMKKIDPIDESAVTILECDKTKPGLQNYSESNQQPLMISLADDKHCLLVDSNIQVKPSYHENSEITSQSIIKPLKFSNPSCQTVSDYVENEPKNLSRNSSPQPKIDEVRDEPNSLAVLDNQNYNKTTDKNVEQIVTNIHSSDKKASILSEVKQANDSFSDENHRIPLIYHPNRNDKTHAMKKIDPIDESAATILECDKTKVGLQNYSVSNQQPLMISLADDKHCLLADSNIQVKPSYHENSEITSQSIIKPLKFSDPSCQTVSDYVENEPKNLSRNSSPQPKIDEVRDEPNSLAVLDNQNYNKTTDKNVEQFVTNFHSSNKKASILSEVKQANDSFSDENHQIPLIYHPNRNDKTHAMKKIDPIDESADTILECDKIKPGLQNYSVSSQQPLMISLADDKHCLLVDSKILVKPSYHENSEITSQSVIKPLKFSDPSCQIVSDYVENEPKNLSRNSSPQPKIDEVRDEPNSFAVLDPRNYNKTTDKNVQQIVNIHSNDQKASILSEVEQPNDSFSDENHQIPLIYHANRNDKTHTMKKVDPIDESAATILEFDKVKTIINDLVECQQPVLINPADDQHSPLVASKIHVKPSIRNDPNSGHQPKKDYTSDNPTPFVTLDTQIESRTTDKNDKNVLKKYDSGNELHPKIPKTKLSKNLPLILDGKIHIKPANPNKYDGKNANYRLKKIDHINTSISVHSLSNSASGKSISHIIANHNQHNDNNLNKYMGINENDEHDLKKCHSGNEVNPEISGTPVNENFGYVNYSKISENKNLVQILHEDIQIKPTNPNNYEDINAKHPLMVIDPVVESTSISTISKKDYVDDIIPIPIVNGFENGTTNENGKLDVKKCEPSLEIPPKVFEFNENLIKPINVLNNYEHSNVKQLTKDIDHVHESVSIVTLGNEIDKNLKKCHSSDEILPKISNYNLPLILDENIQFKPKNSNNYKERKANHRLKEINPIDQSTSISTVHIKRKSAAKKSTSVIILDNDNENTTTNAKTIKHDKRESHPGDEIAINAYKDVKIKPTNNNIVLPLNKFNNLQVNEDCTSINAAINKTSTLSEIENDSFNGFIHEDIKRAFPFQNYTFSSQINTSSITNFIDSLPLKIAYKSMLSSMSPVNKSAYLKMIIGKLGLDAFDSKPTRYKAPVLHSFKKRKPLMVKKVYNIRKKKTSYGRSGARTIIEPHRNKNHNKNTTGRNAFNSNSKNKRITNRDKNSIPHRSDETTAERIITHTENAEINADKPVEDPMISKDNDERNKSNSLCDHTNATENTDNEKNTKVSVFGEPQAANIVKRSSSSPYPSNETTADKIISHIENSELNVDEPVEDPTIRKDDGEGNKCKTTFGHTNGTENMNNKNNLNKCIFFILKDADTLFRRSHSISYLSDETIAEGIITHKENFKLNVDEPVEDPTISKDNDEVNKCKPSCGQTNGTEIIDNENNTKVSPFFEPKDANIVKRSNSIPYPSTEITAERIITHIENSKLNVDEPVEDPTIRKDNDEGNKCKTTFGNTNSTENMDDGNNTKLCIFAEPKEANIVKRSNSIPYLSNDSTAEGIITHIENSELIVDERVEDPTIRKDNNEVNNFKTSCGQTNGTEIIDNENSRKGSIFFEPKDASIVTRSNSIPYPSNDTTAEGIITHIENSELNVDEPIKDPTTREDNNEINNCKTSCGQANSTENMDNEKNTKLCIYAEPKDANIVTRSNSIPYSSNDSTAEGIITHIENSELNVDEPIEDPTIREDNNEVNDFKTSCGQANSTENMDNEDNTKLCIFAEPKDANIVTRSNSVPYPSNDSTAEGIITHIENSELNVDEPIEDPTIREDNNEVNNFKTSCGQANRTENMDNEENTKLCIFAEPKDANIVTRSNSIPYPSDDITAEGIIAHIENSELNVDKPIEDPTIREDNNEVNNFKTSCGQTNGTEIVDNKNNRKGSRFFEPKDANIVTRSNSVPYPSNETSAEGIITHIVNSELNVDEPIEDPTIREDNNEVNNFKTSCGQANGTKNMDNEKNTKLCIFAEPKDANVVTRSNSIPYPSNEITAERIITHIENSKLNVDEPVEDPTIRKDNDEGNKCKTTFGHTNGTENIDDENNTKGSRFFEPKDANIVTRSNSVPYPSNETSAERIITHIENSELNVDEPIEDPTIMEDNNEVNNFKTSCGQTNGTEIIDDENSRKGSRFFEPKDANIVIKSNSIPYPSNGITAEGIITHIENSELNVDELVEDPTIRHDNNETNNFKTSCGQANSTENMDNEKNTKLCIFAEPKDANIVTRSNSIPYPSNDTTAEGIITHIENSELNVDEPIEDPTFREDNNEVCKFKTSCGQANSTENIDYETNTKSRIFSEPKDANVVKGSNPIPYPFNDTTAEGIITHIENSELNVDEPIEDPTIREDNNEVNMFKTSCGQANGTENIYYETNTKSRIFSEPKDANVVNGSNSIPYPSNGTSAERIIIHTENSELDVELPVEDPRISEYKDKRNNYKTSYSHTNGSENLDYKKCTKALIFSEPKDANVVKGSILDSIDNQKTSPNIKTKRNRNKSITLTVNKAYNIRKNKTSYGRFGARKIIEPLRNKDYILDYKTKTRDKRNANEEHNSSPHKKTIVDRKDRRIENIEVNVNLPVDDAKNRKDVSKKRKTACTNDTTKMKKDKSTKTFTVSESKHLNKVPLEDENIFELINDNDGDNYKICGKFNLPSDIYFKTSSIKRKIPKKYKLNTKLNLDDLQIKNLNQDRTYNLLLPKKFQSFLSQEDAVSKICLSPKVVLKEKYSPSIKTRKSIRDAIFS